MNDVFKYLGNRFQLLLWFGLFVFYFWSYSFKATGSFMLIYSFSKTISISSTDSVSSEKNPIINNFCENIQMEKCVF